MGERMRLGSDGEAKTAERRPGLNRAAIAALIGAWGVGAALVFLLGEPAGARFLDLPLGAYLAGQGALMSGLVLGARAAFPVEAEARR